MLRQVREEITAKWNKLVKIVSQSKKRNNLIHFWVEFAIQYGNEKPFLSAMQENVFATLLKPIQNVPKPLVLTVS